MGQFFQIIRVLTLLLNFYLSFQITENNKRYYKGGNKKEMEGSDRDKEQLEGNQTSW